MLLPDMLGYSVNPVFRHCVLQFNKWSSLTITRGVR
ncbi:hypothetical protein AGR13a_Lc90457 [Agrobacterium genomosp. 13 str. CFBP 6927]|uniref:Uncharacterized protein n=1 Tax=Agrobacterium genomosp. 13 str. CFBP 6927 TaxID=1183428 RepID=A0ABP2BRS5_9HYPH|nr:hypothetical protein AGR13a_Lc90457 [Agrobacterium genomosp. 13 str. CFBP 6927]